MIFLDLEAAGTMKSCKIPSSFLGLNHKALRLGVQAENRGRDTGNMWHLSILWRNDLEKVTLWKLSLNVYFLITCNHSTETAFL